MKNHTCEIDEESYRVHVKGPDRGGDADVSYLGISYPSILDISYPELRGVSYLDAVFCT